MFKTHGACVLRREQQRLSQPLHDNFYDYSGKMSLNVKLNDHNEMICDQNSFVVCITYFISIYHIFYILPLSHSICLSDWVCDPLWVYCAVTPR